MKRVLVVLAACGGGGTGDDFPVEPGGPMNPGSNTPRDAAAIDAPDPDALSTFGGRVCLAADLRAPVLGCATTGVGGLTVALGTKTATTMPDGTFAIDKPAGSGLVWRITGGAGFVPSLVPFGAQTILPIMSAEDYNDLQLANSALVVTGSVMVRVVKNGAVQAGVAASISPASDGAAHYANNGEFAWPELASGTSAFGMIWFPNAVLGLNTVTASLGGANPPQAAGPVEDQAITYLTLELP